MRKLRVIVGLFISILLSTVFSVFNKPVNLVSASETQNISLTSIINNVYNNNLNDISNQYFDYGLRHGSIGTSSGSGETKKILPGCVKFDKSDSSGNIYSTNTEAKIIDSGKTLSSIGDDRIIVKFVAKTNLIIKTSANAIVSDPNSASDSEIKYYIFDSYSEQNSGLWPSADIKIDKINEKTSEDFTKEISLKKGQIFYWEWGFQFTGNFARTWKIDSSNSNYCFEIETDDYEQKEVNSEEYYYLNQLELSSTIAGNDLDSTKISSQTLLTFGFRHGSVQNGNINKFTTFAPNVLGYENDGEPESTFMQNWRISSVNNDGAIIYIKAQKNITLIISREAFGNDSLAGASLNIYKNDNTTPLYSATFDGENDKISDFNYQLELLKDEYIYYEFIHKGNGYGILSMGDSGTEKTTLPLFRAIESNNIIEKTINTENIVNNIYTNNTNITNNIGSYEILVGNVENSTLSSPSVTKDYIGNDDAKFNKNSIYVNNDTLTFKITTKYDLVAYLNFNNDEFNNSNFKIKAYQYVNSIGKTHQLYDVTINDKTALDSISNPFVLTRNDIVYVEFISINGPITFTNLESITFKEKALGDGISNSYPLYDAIDRSNLTSIDHKTIAYDSARINCNPITTKDFDISLLTGQIKETRNDENEIVSIDDKTIPFKYIQYESGEYLEGNTDKSMFMSGDASLFDGSNFAAVEDWRIKTSLNNSVVYKITANKDTQIQITHPLTKASDGWIKTNSNDEPQISFKYYQSNNKQIKLLDVKEVNSSGNDANTFAYNFNLKANDTAYLVFDSDSADQRNLGIVFNFTSVSESYNEEARNSIFSDASTTVYLYDTITAMLNTSTSTCDPISYEDCLEINLAHGDVNNPTQFIRSECSGDGNGSSKDALFSESSGALKAGFQRWQIQAGKSNDNAIIIYKALKDICLSISHDATKESWASFSSFKYYIADTDGFLDYKGERFVSSDLGDDYFGFVGENSIHLKAGQSLIIVYQSNDEEQSAVVDLVLVAEANTKDFDISKVNNFDEGREIENIKEECRNSLNNKLTILNEDDYSVSNWAKIESYIYDFNTNVADLDTIDDINELFNTYNNKIDQTLNIVQEEQLLLDTKQWALDEARAYIDANKDYYNESTLSSIEMRFSALKAQVNISSSVETIKVRLLSFESYVDSLPKDKIIMRNAFIIGGCILGALVIASIGLTILIKLNNRKKLYKIERSVSTLKYENDADYLVPLKGKKAKRFKAYIKRYWPLYLMLLPMVIYLFIFSYIPMGGLTLAFKDFNFRLGTWASPWATTDGELDLFKYFRELFENPEWWESFVITLKISGLRLLVGFFIPIIMTILLTEVKSKKFSKGFQIISYLPHFLSWVVIYGILISLTTSNSPLQNLLTKIIGHEVGFFSDPDIFLWLVILSNIWKEAGWSTIIYFAAAASINPELYEAASVDGVKRWGRILHVTLPGLIPAISINLILQASGFVFGGFEQIFAMTGNGVNQVILPYVNITEIFLYKAGITSFQYSLATVVGLFNSVISLILVLIANHIIKRIGGDGLW